MIATSTEVGVGCGIDWKISRSDHTAGRKFNILRTPDAECGGSQCWPSLLNSKNDMDKKTEKKKRKMQDRIAVLETELANSLAKKDTKTVEIDVGSHMRKIADMKAELARM